MTVVNSNAQDTLTRPFIGITTYPSDIAYFYGNFDSTYLQPVQNVDINNSTGHAIYMNPNDNMLYAVLDSATSPTSPRAIYKINPFNGAKTLAYDLANKYASVEIAPDGRIFGIHGNGTSTPGALYEIDVVNQSQTFLMNVPVPANEPRALGFNSNDGNLYVFSSFLDSVYVIDTASWTSQRMYSLMNGWEVHGVYFENDTFYLSAYGGQVQNIDVNNGLDATVISDLNESYMDLTRFKMINSNSSVSVCSNSSLELTALYQSNSYQWYYNGMPVSNATNDTLVVTQGGTYKLLSQVGTTSHYVFSEDITVTILNAPVVTITGTDTTYCPGDSITLTATAGGTGQWYLNGSPIANATSNTYIATWIGNYNYLKTNLNGCSDSSATGFQIYGDLTCPPPTFIPSVEDASSIKLYPNPAANEFTLEMNTSAAYIQVCDINGKTVMTVTANGARSTVNVADLAPGLYIVKAMSNNDETLTMQKLAIIK